MVVSVERPPDLHCSDTRRHIAVFLCGFLKLVIFVSLSPYLYVFIP